MSIEEQISELIDKYEGLDARRLRQFNEENTKKDFILPLFRHLGWDVSNSDEVAAEEKSSNGRVDYAFKVGGVSKFYLEAKPLREDLNQRPDWAKQVITYAENKGVTWAVLTNFKQLMVFNAEWDKPALERARFLNLTYQEYLPAFQKLWWLSRDSVEKGVLDEEARQVGALKPKLPVEKSLLDQLLRWRGELFNQIYQHNKDKGLDLLQVDEPIQQFINRLIFIRSTEDRGIEENRLRATLHQWRDSGRQGELVERIRAIFHEFATLYDSDLFPLLDTWDSVFVESDTIERIIEGSYERPTRLAGYDFAAIDPKVLGAIYEQYLGYVAQEAKKRATEQARLLGFEAPDFELEARRIKRKQQGIYYTPEFVVDYIVKETVGRFIKEHSYNDIFNIKILDPACGSGSFLIRAYDELLHYHARQQGKSPAELDQLERRPILLRNIFGVDLDRQAVEITRLSLLLSCVAKREILPSLKDNIREGNSLISGTEEELKKYFGDNWREKKPFNWEQEFKDIMANGGFDVVIGNPPYVRGRSLPAPEKVHYSRAFKTAYKSYDLYVLFIERGLELLNDGGIFSMIVSRSLLGESYATMLRKHILDTCCIREIVDFAGKAVFEQAMVTNCILVLQKQPDRGKRDSNPVRVTKWADKSTHEVIQRTFSDMPLYMFRIDLSEKDWAIIAKVRNQSIELGDLCYVSYSIAAHSEIEGRKKEAYIFTQRIDDKCKPFIEGKELSRYSLKYMGRFLQYDPRILRRPSLPELFENEKIVFKGVSAQKRGLVAYYDNQGYYVGYPAICATLKYHLANVERGDIKVTEDEAETSKQFNLRYILALINSSLMDFYFTKLIRSTVTVYSQDIRQVPIKRVSAEHQQEFASLVDKMLELNKHLAPIRNTPSATQEELLREIKRTDAEIDQKVYELYGLTEEEKQIIEASLAKTVF